MRLSSQWYMLDAWTKAALGFLVSATLMLVLTLFGWMKTIPIALALFPFCFGSIAALFQLGHAKDWVRFLVIGWLICIPVFSLMGEIPSIFSGRDQGSIALAAWELAHHEELPFHDGVTSAFFDIYGPGTALNFPGFAYTQTGALVTQFPLGYIAWLAGFVSWLGLAGFHVANGCLFVIAGWTFFELASLIVRRPLAFIGMLLFSATFLPVWLLHFTLSEHLALALFLIMSLGLVRFLSQPTGWAYSLTGLAASLFLFTRIEGWALMVVAMIIGSCQSNIRAWITSSIFTKGLLPLFLIGFLLLRDFFINLPFYTVMAKVFLKEWHALMALGWSSTTAIPTENLFSIFSRYGLSLIGIFGMLGIAIACFQKHKILLTVVALALPTFAYLFDAHITPDHPWMLRRYAFTLWPICLMGALFLWHRLEERFPRLSASGITLLIAVSIGITQYFPARTAWHMDETSLLYRNTQEIAGRINGQDLVLVDRLASGSPYQLLSGPLQSVFGKQSAYFFNPEDLMRLDLNAYERVFFIGSASAKEKLEQTAPLLTWKERRVFTFMLPQVSTRTSFFPTIEILATPATLFELNRP